MCSQQADQSVTIGREGLLRLVEVVERLTARDCEASVSSWTATGASAPDAGCERPAGTVGRAAGGQSPGGGALAGGDHGEGRRHVRDVDGGTGPGAG
jgi:hypothetical protein